MAALAAAVGAQGASAQLPDLHGVATPLSPPASAPSSAPVTQAAAQTSAAAVTQVAAQASGPTSAVGQVAAAPVHDGAVPVLAQPSSGGRSTAPRVPTAAVPRTPAQAGGGPVLAGVRLPAAPATVVARVATRVQPTLEGVPAAVRSDVSAGSTVVAAVTDTAPASLRGAVLPSAGPASVPVLARTVLPTLAGAVRTVVTTLPETPVESGSSLPSTATAVATVAGALGGQPRGGSPVGGAGSHGGGPGASPERDLPTAAPSTTIVTPFAPTDPAASGLAPASAAVGPVAAGSASGAYPLDVRARVTVTAGGHDGKAASSRLGFRDEGRLMVIASLVDSRSGGLFSQRGAVDPSSASVPGGEMTPLAPAGSSSSVAGSSSATGISLLLTLAILAIAGNATVGRRLRLAGLPKRAAPVLLLPSRPG